MARRKKKNKGRAINIVITALSLMIIAVIGIMTAFVYNYLTKPVKEAVDENETEITIDEEITTTVSETVTSESVSMTKRTTTDAETADDTGSSEITDTTTETQTENSETTQAAPSADIAYKPEFFENDLFIGDSISTGFSGYGFLPAENVFAQVGLNPSTVLEKEVNGYTISGKLSEMQPERVYIMLGSNGIAFLSGTYMCEQMKILIDTIRTQSPTSKIIIISVPPVTYEHDQEGQETIADINAYNDELKQLASDEDCPFIDISAFLKNENGYLSADYAEADGMHFLGGAYVTVLNYIESCIENS